MLAINNTDPTAAFQTAISNAQRNEDQMKNNVGSIIRAIFSPDAEGTRGEIGTTIFGKAKGMAGNIPHPIGG